MGGEGGERSVRGQIKRGGWMKRASVWGFNLMEGEEVMSTVGSGEWGRQDVER